MELSKDEIIRMAKESGAVERYFGNQLHGIAFHKKEWLERFAALVAAHEREKQISKYCQKCSGRGWYTCGASDQRRKCPECSGGANTKIEAAVLAEREACAKVCESMYNSPTFSDEYIECADAIRSRSNEH